MARKKYDLEYVKKYFIEQGCELLETEYKHVKQKIKYKCSCGNAYETNFDTFQRKHLDCCNGCRFNFMKKYFLEQRCELLETEYKNSCSLVRYRCSCGNISSVRFSCFKRGDRCKRCHYEKISKSLSLDIEFVKSYFYQQGCELLEKTYKNAHIPLKYKCSCGNISKICFDSFKHGNRCKKCGNKKISDKQRLTYEYVKNYFKSKNCELLESDYKDAHTKMKYKCVCGNISAISFNNFSHRKRCLNCFVISVSGSNNYQWREDREQVKIEFDFKQRCYKMLKRILKYTGRIKSTRTEGMLGYSYKQLIEKITKHDNWENVKNDKWHLDHIFPVKAFFDYNIYDIKLINCLDNLQPLTVKENCFKSDKYNKEEFETWLQQKGFAINE